MCVFLGGISIGLAVFVLHCRLIYIEFSLTELLKKVISCPKLIIMWSYLDHNVSVEISLGFKNKAWYIWNLGHLTIWEVPCIFSYAAMYQVQLPRYFHTQVSSFKFCTSRVINCQVHGRNFENWKSECDMLVAACWFAVEASLHVSASCVCLLPVGNIPCHWELPALVRQSSQWQAL